MRVAVFPLDLPRNGVAEGYSAGQLPLLHLQINSIFLQLILFGIRFRGEMSLIYHTVFVDAGHDLHTTIFYGCIV